MGLARYILSYLLLGVLMLSCATPLLFLGGKHILHHRAAHSKRSCRTARCTQSRSEEEPILILTGDEMQQLSFEEIGNGVLEFKWGGKMHDVHRIDTVNGGQYKLYGEVDHEESALNRIVSRYVNRAKEQIQSRFFLFYFNDAPWFVNLLPPFFSFSTSFSGSDQYNSPLFGIDPPPPKF